MTIFLSHKQEDTDAAKRIHKILIDKGIPCYLDVLDPATKTQDITDLILRRLGQCTYLMAILSSKSKESWWIPFEIGAASMDGHKISTYKIDSVTPPEYLEKWPILYNEKHLEKYASLYKTDSTISLEASTSRTLNESKEIIKRADNFHADMKRFINLGY